MRITNSMMVNQFLRESNDALSRLSKYQSQVDSTKRISSISDDPQATTMALRARNKLSNIALYQSNITTASSYLTEAENAASSINDILMSAYEDIISAQSGTKTQSDLIAIAEDVKNLQEEILNIANTTIGSSFLFGGFNYTGTTDGVTKTPPFSVDGSGNLLYNGIDVSVASTALTDEAAKRTTIQIGSAQTVELTMTGLDLLGTEDANIYNMLGKCVKMLNGDLSTDGLSDMVTALQDAQSSVLTLETKIGSTQNRLAMTSSRYDSSETNYTQMKSEAEDVDMAEAIMNLTTAQSVYNAALAGGAKLIKTSLMDFLS